MNKNTRLELNDSMFSACAKLSEGNPGALTVLCRVMEIGNDIDPIGMGAFGFILMLDSFAIYGPRIWMLYKDVCKEDVIKTMAVVRGCQLGLISEDEMNVAIDGGTLDTDQVLSMVRVRLGQFGETNE